MNMTPKKENLIEKILSFISIIRGKDIHIVYSWGGIPYYIKFHKN